MEFVHDVGDPDEVFPNINSEIGYKISFGLVDRD